MGWLIKFKRIALLGLKNFWRNGWLSVAATLMMTLTLLIITVFVIFNLLITNIINNAKDKIDLAVYFKDTVPEEQIIDLQLKLKVRDDVQEVEYIDKAKALVIFRALPLKEEVKNLVKSEDNILPRSLRVKAKQPESIEQIAQFFATPGFETKIDHISTKDNQAIVDRLINLTHFTRWVGVLVSGLFFFIALIVIFNTIRLTIFARREELEIMQLVGASWSFIRLPFLVEALLYAIFGTILSTVILILGFRIIQGLSIQFLDLAQFDFSAFLFSHLWLAISWQLLLGLFTALFSSTLSVRKYLKV